MSQSPIDPENEKSQTDEYLNGWNELATMIRNGRSFSGRERNCCFLNTGATGRFANVSSATGFDFADDGRGLALVDWDHDGDLDAWIANRTGPRVRLLLNQTNANSKNHYVSIRLRGTRCNRDAIGARVRVVTRGDGQLENVQTLRAGEGFLSQSSKWLHFGLGDNEVDRVLVHWPGAEVPEEFVDVKSGGRFELVQGQSAAKRHEARSLVQLPPSKLASAKSGEQARIVVLHRLSIDETEFRDFSDQRQEVVERRPVLLNLWAPWCAPCIAEFEAFEARQDEISRSGVDIVALSVDQIQGAKSDASAVANIARRFAGIRGGWASQQLVRELTTIQNRVIYRQKSLPLPCSFLLNSDGSVAVIYRGAVDVTQLISDVAKLGSRRQMAAVAVDLGGRNVSNWFAPDPPNVAKAFLEGGYVADAKSKLEAFVLQADTPDASGYAKRHLVPSLRLLADIAKLEGRAREHTIVLNRISELQPKDADIQIELGQAYVRATKWEDAVQAFGRAVDLEPDSQEARFNLAMAYQLSDRADEAVQQYEALLAKQPNLHDAANNLAWTLTAKKNRSSDDVKRALDLARRICSATEFKNSSYLDTLATAQLANGEKKAAMQTLRRAIRGAQDTNDQDTVRKLRKRLEALQK